MRVALVSTEYPPETGGGGIGTQTALKARGLSARGHHVEVICGTWTQERVEHDGPVKVHRTLLADLGVGEVDASTRWLAYSMCMGRKLQEIHAEYNFDIIQFPEYGGEGFIHQINNFETRRPRYCVQLHGPLAMFAEHMGWPEKRSTFYEVGCFMERASIHRADGVMASSHNTARFCAQRYDYALEKIEVIHSGLDVQRFSLVAHKDEGDGPRILFVGVLVWTKGFPQVVDAVLKLRQRYPKIQLRAIGKGDDDDLKRAKQRIAAAEAHANVQILGYRPHDELAEHFAWCDFFAAPSLYEPGPGNVYLEAMSCGRPVIASNTAGAPEVVLDGQTGLLVAPNDAEALERAIVTLADDASLRASLGEDARKWVVENFSTDRYIDKVEGFYQRLLERPLKPR